MNTQNIKIGDTFRRINKGFPIDYLVLNKSDYQVLIISTRSSKKFTKIVYGGIDCPASINFSKRSFAFHMVTRNA